MLQKPLKVALYSGQIPSTTFIERLIVGLSELPCEIFLFGAVVKPTDYPSAVHMVGYRQSRFLKFFYLLKYSFLLFFFKSSKKRVLDAMLKAENRLNLYNRVKFYPVLWYQPDVFHVQWAKGLEEWLWVKAFDIKLVLSLRGAHINYSPLADTRLSSMYQQHFNKVDAFHAVSKAIAKEARKYGATSDRTKVIYSGLDVEGFHGTPRSQTGPFQILSVGRPHWKKGYVYALDAMKLLKDSKVDFHYSIIGGANTIELQYHIEDLGLQNDVTLTGQKSFETVKSRMQSANLLLLPSVEEGIANVVLEAMALQTPVLTTNCGGMEEVVKHSQNGFVVPIRDAKAIADAILKIKAMPTDEMATIVSEAFQTVTKGHSQKAMVAQMLELYQSTLSDTL